MTYLSLAMTTCSISATSEAISRISFTAAPKGTLVRYTLLARELGSEPGLVYAIPGVVLPAVLSTNSLTLCVKLSTSTSLNLVIASAASASVSKTIRPLPVSSPDGFLKSLAY